MEQTGLNSVAVCLLCVVTPADPGTRMRILTSHTTLAPDEVIQGCQMYWL